MNKTITNYSNRAVIVCVVLIPLLLILVAHYNADKEVSPAKIHDQPTVEVSPGLSDLLLKI